MPENIGTALAGLAVIVAVGFVIAIIIHNPFMAVIAVAIVVGIVALLRSRRRARNRV